MINITEIIKENNKEIKNFKSNILRLEKLNDNDSFHFSNMLLQNMYKLIDNTFTFLFSNNCRPKEKEIIVIQLEKLHHMFFGELSTMYSDGLWELYQEREQEYYNEKHTFDPINFKSDFILEQINKLKTQIKPKKPTDSWFKVGIELANGKAFEIFNKYKSIKVREKRTVITKYIFGNKYEKSYDLYVYGSINGYKSVDKNIFNRSNAEDEIRKIIEHSKKKGDFICKEFIGKCKEYNISID
ncbi:hypothetical protein SL053_001089 [Flavobacterium psychrophilum]|nr:hypothetical protein [Flavobacterium psychrophilum]